MEFKKQDLFVDDECEIAGVCAEALLRFSSYYHVKLQLCCEIYSRKRRDHSKWNLLFDYNFRLRGEPERIFFLISRASHGDSL